MTQVRLPWFPCVLTCACFIGNMGVYVAVDPALARRRQLVRHFVVHERAARLVAASFVSQLSRMLDSLPLQRSCCGLNSEPGGQSIEMLVLSGAPLFYLRSIAPESLSCMPCPSASEQNSLMPFLSAPRSAKFSLSGRLLQRNSVGLGFGDSKVVSSEDVDDSIGVASSAGVTVIWCTAIVAITSLEEDSACSVPVEALSTGVTT